MQLADSQSSPCRKGDAVSFVESGPAVRGLVATEVDDGSIEGMDKEIGRAVGVEVDQGAGYRPVGKGEPLLKPPGGQQPCQGETRFFPCSNVRCHQKVCAKSWKIH